MSRFQPLALNFEPPFMALLNFHAVHLRIAFEESITRKLARRIRQDKTPRRTLAASLGAAATGNSLCRG
jgi:hypothetical protein